MEVKGPAATLFGGGRRGLFREPPARAKDDGRPNSRRREGSYTSVYLDDIRDLLYHAASHHGDGFHAPRLLQGGQEDERGGVVEGGRVFDGRVALDLEPARESVFYLNTKRLRMGHLIELAS